ncbi:putative zinc finger protein [Tripterygium wilfordii]|uniref:Putative zinc finger protein n=1 Tax=Tripterygium wilfordii TaxID=458696 RepID=A0A7J7CW07_TRIWF|nr:putative zinc finger protein [Tripterygium wilfordii]
MDCKCRLLLYFVVFVLSDLKINGVHGDQQVPCYFIFGDSLSDSGNNNNLSTSAKANYLPYGIDFPAGPTGRFCNGRTTVDVITKLLGFEEFIPPYATANGSELLQGVNYASGSAGIRDETGKQLGHCISIDEQLQHHKITISNIVNILGDQTQATNHLNKCLYSVQVGSNDYLNNYFVPEYYKTSTQYTPEQYAAVLAKQYSHQLRTLYNHGARKFALFGMGPIGCTPHAIMTYGTSGSLCVDKLNDAAMLFNDQLKLLTDQLNMELKDAKFAYVNILEIMLNLAKYFPDFKPAVSPCCPVNEFGQCVPSKSPCFLRNLHIFWDAFHPTEAANIITAIGSYPAFGFLNVQLHEMDLSGLPAQFHSVSINSRTMLD